MKAKINELENKGIIKKKIDPTDWISSMVIIAKPQKVRICLDSKDLNQTLKKSKYQMPTRQHYFYLIHPTKHATIYILHMHISNKKVIRIYRKLDEVNKILDITDN